MARIGAGAAMAGSLNEMGDAFLKIALMKQQQKQQELENQLRREMVNQDNARWVAQDTYRREQDGIRQGEAAEAARRADERFKYQQEQDAYQQNMSRIRDERDYYAGQEKDARDYDTKLEALKQKYQAEADGAGARDYMPKPFEQDVGGTKMRGLYNPSTGSFELAKPEREPTISVGDDGTGVKSSRRSIPVSQFNTEQAQMGEIESQLEKMLAAKKADPKAANLDPYMSSLEKARQQIKRGGGPINTQVPAQPAGTGAFAPPQNAATMGNMDKAAILEEAAKAIQAGKDPLAVKKRLQEMGIQY